jgi:Heavy metal binding domain
MRLRQIFVHRSALMVSALTPGVETGVTFAVGDQKNIIFNLFTFNYFNMKKSLFVFLVFAAFTACKNEQSAAPKMDAPKPTTTETAPTPAPEVAPVAAAYACPMHPEITGKEGDKCPKCKMALTPVKK